jgi:hypothetical protein
MKISRLLMFAAIGIAAGLLLTQTDKGNELRRSMGDSAGELGRKLGKLRRRSGEVADDLLSDVSNAAKKIRSKNGQVA